MAKWSLEPLTPQPDVKKYLQRGFACVWYLQELVVALPVDSDADVDGDDGEYDARQCNGGELVDKCHADVHDQRHHQQQARAVHSEVVVHDFGVLGEVAEYRQPRCHVRLQKTRREKI